MDFGSKQGRLKRERSFMLITIKDIVDDIMKTRTNVMRRMGNDVSIDDVRKMRKAERPSEPPAPKTRWRRDELYLMRCQLINREMHGPTPLLARRPSTYRVTIL